MTMPADVPLPPTGDTDWSDWGAEIEELTDIARTTATTVTTGRLSDDALRAAFGAQAADSTSPLRTELAKVFGPVDPVLSNFATSNFAHFRAAVAKMRGGGTPVRISFYGDSQTNGYQASDGPNYVRSPGYRAMQILDRTWEASRLGVMFPRVAPIGVGVSQAKPQFVLGAGWTQFGNNGSGQGPLNSGSVQADFNAAGALTITADDCDTFKVYAVQYAGGATLGAAIDGGAVTTVDTTVAGATPGRSVLTVTTATPGTHTLAVTSSGTVGTNFVLAVEAYNSQKQQARVTIFGASGASANSWTLTLTGPYASDPMLWGAVADPDLVVFMVGTNDHAASRSLTDVATEVGITVDRAKANGADVILAAPPPGNSGDLTTWDDLRDTLKAVAVAKGCGFVDTQARWGSYATMSAAPYSYWDDADHPNATGYADLGALLAAGVRAAAGD